MCDLPDFDKELQKVKEYAHWEKIVMRFADDGDRGDEECLMKIAREKLGWE